MLDIYNDKLDRRKEAKNVLFQRGLMEHKKVSLWSTFRAWFDGTGSWLVRGGGGSERKGGLGVEGGDRTRERETDAFADLSFSSSQIQAAERKKPQKERDLVAKYKVFAKLQTAEDHEVFIEGLLCESSFESSRVESSEGEERTGGGNKS